MMFLGTQLEDDIVEELVANTVVLNEFISVEDNVVINLVPRVLFTKENFKIWEEVLQKRGHSLSLMSSFYKESIRCSVELLNDIKLRMDSNSNFVESLKPFIQKHSASLNELDKPRTIDTGAKRKKVIDTLEKVLKAESSENRFLQLYKFDVADSTDEDYCDKQYENARYEYDIDSKKDYYWEIKLDIFANSNKMIEKDIVEYFSTRLEINDNEDDQYEKIISDRPEYEYVFGLLLKKREPIEIKRVIRSLKQSKANIIALTPRPYYIIYCHLIIYYTEIMYVLQEHTESLKNIKYICDSYNTSEAKKEYFLEDFMNNNTLQLTKPMYKLYATINRRYENFTDKGTTVHIKVLSLLVSLSNEKLQSEYSKVATLMANVFYDKAEKGIKTLDSESKNNTLLASNIEDITFDNLLELFQ